MSQAQSTSRGRGRPTTFAPGDRAYFAELIRVYGMRGAQRQSKLSVSMPTLIGVAREFRIEMKKGKRSSQPATILLAETRTDVKRCSKQDSQERKAA